jgi:hypothetical protein
MIFARFAEQYLGFRLHGNPLRPTWRSSEPAPSDPMQLGEAAKRLLDDPTLHLALTRVQAKLIETWKSTAIGEVEAREAAYRLHWAAEQFKSELRIMVGNARGIEAKARLDERQ